MLISDKIRGNLTHFVHTLALCPAISLRVGSLDKFGAKDIHVILQIWLEVPQRLSGKRLSDNFSFDSMIALVNCGQSTAGILVWYHRVVCFGLSHVLVEPIDI